MDPKDWIRKYVSKLAKQIEPTISLSSGVLTSFIIILVYLVHRASLLFVKKGLKIDKFYSTMFTGEMLRRMFEERDIMEHPQNLRTEPNPLLCNKSGGYVKETIVMFKSWSLPTTGKYSRLLCVYIEYTIAELIYTAMIMSYKKKSTVITLDDICSAISNDSELLYTFRFFTEDIKRGYFKR